MKRLLRFVKKHLILSVSLVLLLIIAIVSVSYQLTETNPLPDKVHTDTSKMDKFKSGTYQHAKKIGY